MPLQFNRDVIAALKDKGYNTNRIRKEKLFSQSTLQKFRTNQGVDWKNIEMLCRLLECQPNDFMEYISEEKQEQEDTPS